MATNAMVSTAKVVQALAPVTPSTSTPDYVSLKNFDRCMIVVSGKNATTVTGSAITLKQATAVAGTSEKELAFTTVYANTDTAASDTLTATAVAANTFTTTATNSKNFIYVIDVDAATLDVANGFDCVRLGTGNAVATTIDVVYVCYASRYRGDVLATSAITD